jgi:AraC family transcriptional regulator
MYLRKELLEEKTIIGMSMQMNFANHKPELLWGKFMPLLKKQGVDSDTKLYSIEVFSDHFFQKFDMQAEFTKWAGVELNTLHLVFDEFEKLIIPTGWYAVFLHKGSAINAADTYNYIFREWLPQSGNKLDNRPHFAIMDSKYQRNSNDSEEEIWIPILNGW